MFLFVLTLFVHSALAQENFWVRVNDPAEGSFRTGVANSEGHVFVIQEYKSLYRTIDNGFTWIELQTPSHSFVSVLETSPNDEMFLGTVDYL